MARENKGNRESRRQTQTIAKAHEDQAGSLTISQTREFSGPIPSPEILAGYEHALPGSADRIIRMTESEVKHRQSIEVTAITAQTKDISDQRMEVRFGQIGAMSIGIAALIAGAYAATHGAQIVGGGISGGTVVALVSAFLYRQHVSVAKPMDLKQPTDDEIAIPPLQKRIDT